MRLLGLDLGGSKLLACGLDDGVIAFRSRRPTGRSFGPADALAAIVELATEARGALGGLDAVGIGFPGLVDHHRGLARSSTMLDGWCDVDLADRVARALDVRCVVDNDVNAAALHEHACRRASDLLYVAVGTGIGGALVLGGALWRGAGGFAGELGHVSIDRAGRPCPCGRRGCVHLYASGSAIERAAQLGPGALAAGARAPEAIRAAADALGIAIGSALNVLDVPQVVLGGGVAELGPVYTEAVAARIRRECFREIGERCVVSTARGGYEAGALGAAMLARQAATSAARSAIG
ncbi:MAG TPA: ROK family protein [Kofleriaceae bacterium]|nr:ROK family protein [Kofleriaceae bacterium]